MENILQLIESGFLRFGTTPCMRFKVKKEWVTWTWVDVERHLYELMGGLLKLGVAAGDKIAILSNTRLEWTLADFAALSCGAITIPVYQSSLTDQVHYILTDADCSGIFVEDKKQLDKVLSVAAHLPKLKWIAVFDAAKIKAQCDRTPAVYKYSDLFEKDTFAAKAVFNKHKVTLTSDQDLTYVYTSGTTGDPKAVILTHHNFLSNAKVTTAISGLSPKDEALSFLPLSHIMARLFQFVHFQAGFVQAFAESIDHLFANIQEIRPHFMVSVPRIFEKIHTKVVSDLNHASPLKRCIFNWAAAVGREATGLQPRHWSRLFPGALLVQRELASRLVYRPLQQKLGGRIRFFISGGAPLAQEIAEFFYTFDILILEGYGLTETTAPVTLNRPDRFKFGTVGLPLPNCDIKIAPDGEILVKGDPVFKGYYKNPQTTKECFQAGWFATGDIGTLDADGFLKITDRKKDIIVTSGGKNIAPQHIENIMKTIPLVSQFVVHGDKRKFLSALVVLDKEELDKFVRSHRIAIPDGKQAWESPEICKIIKDEIDNRNKELASYETIKKFAIIGKEFTIDSGELTPTLKVKRKVIGERYKENLDQFYREG